MNPLDLRLLRARLGLSQTEAAALCDVQDRTWRRWESGAYAPGPDQLAPCFDLLAKQDRTVSEAVALAARLRKEHGGPDVVTLTWSGDEQEARSRGWPCANAWLAVLRRVSETVGAPVAVIEP